MWNVEKREDIELTEEYRKNLNHLLNAPKGPIMLIALFGVCYWWGDYIINSKVTGFAEYLMWKGKSNSVFMSLRKPSSCRKAKDWVSWCWWRRRDTKQIQ